MPAAQYLKTSGTEATVVLQWVAVTTATEDQWITLLSRNSVGCVVNVCCSCEGLYVKRSWLLHG